MKPTDAGMWARWEPCCGGRIVLVESEYLAAAMAPPERWPGTGSVKRGPKAPPKDVRDTRIAELERETRRLQRKLTQAETNHWHPKKSCHAAGDPSAERGRRRARLRKRQRHSQWMWEPPRHAEHSESLVRRCIARQPPPTVVRIPRASHRALSDVERQEVLDLLHSQRFVDSGPRTGCRSPTGRRALSVFGAHDVSKSWMRMKRFANGGTNAVIRPIPDRSCWPRVRIRCGVGILQAQGAAEVDLLLPVRDSRHFQSPGCGLDGGRL